MMAAEGESLETMIRSSGDIIVFGSRASHVNRKCSDLDILVVGEKRGRKRIGALDLVYIPVIDTSRALWRRTELPRHIERFGVSLMHDSVSIAAIYDDYAALRKRARLKVLLERVILSWGVLDGGFRRKYLIKLRREVQRYRLLEQGLAVPPTVCLDSAMTSFRSIEQALEDLVVVAAPVESHEVYCLLRSEAHQFASSLVMPRANMRPFAPQVRA
jgi:predicted nucleotidyltransferase